MELFQIRPLIVQAQKIALKELKSNHNLIITKADKGGQIVLLDMSTYVEKVENLIKEGRT